MRDFALLRVAVLLFITHAAYAAVHKYNDDYFYAVADAYIFRGGREGLYASTREVHFLQSVACVYSSKLESSRERVTTMRRP